MGFDVGRFREGLGISQEKMAEHLNVHPRTVRRWEGGYTSPSPMALAALKRLKITPQQEDETATGVGKGPMMLDAAPSSKPVRRSHSSGVSGFLPSGG